MKISKQFFTFLIFGLALSSILLISNSYSADPPQKKENSQPSQVETKIIEQLAENLSNHVKSIDQSISYLSLTIVIITALFSIGSGIMVFMIDKKTSSNEKRNIEVYQKEIERLRDKTEKLQDTAKSLMNDIKSDILNDDRIKEINDHIKKENNKQLAKMKDDYELYKNTLIAMLENIASTEKNIHYKDSLVKWEYWQLSHNDIRDFIVKEDYIKAIEKINDYIEYSFALSQITSGEPQAIFTGIGSLNDKLPKEFITDNLWNFLVFLKEEKRITDQNQIMKISEIGQKINKTLSGVS